MDRQWAARELGHFLRTRRERIDHTIAGEVSHVPRRKNGLRRTELASLAGVSPDYYARLEQGRAPNPSNEVLGALANALGLDEAERFHMRALAERVRDSPAVGLTTREPLATPNVSVLEFPSPNSFEPIMAAISGAPAMVIDHRMDVLAWNPLASMLITDFASIPQRHRNTTWQLFTNGEFGARYADWETVARQNVAFLRASYGRHGGDRRIAALVADLADRSARFAEWWAAHDVEEKTSGVKCFEHPAVGGLTLRYEALRLPGDAERHLVLYAADAGSRSEDKLQILRAMESLSSPGRIAR